MTPPFLSIPHPGIGFRFKLRVVIRGLSNILFPTLSLSVCLSVDLGEENFFGCRNFSLHYYTCTYSAIFIRQANSAKSACTQTG